MKSKVSSKDVAKLAGVSQSTVSRAFSDSYNLSADLKEKVFSAAKELGYRPNAIGRILYSSKSNIVGIVASKLDNPFYSVSLQYFVKKLQEHSLQALVFVAEQNEDIDTVIDRVLSYQVDLVVIFSAKSTTTMARILVSNDTPTLLFNRYIPLSQTSAVCCNDYESGRYVAQQLYASGCRNFAYIAGEENITTNIDRRNGFTAGLSDLGIVNIHIVPGGYSYEEGLEAGKYLCTHFPKVDACFCANDITAVGLIDYLRYTAGKLIPEDISVVGFDDIPIAGQMSYQLTTVRQPIEGMVDAAISTILETLENPKIKPVLKIVEGEYVKRCTTR